MSLSHLPTFQTYQQVIRMMKQSLDKQLNNDIIFFTIAMFLYIFFVTYSLLMVQILLVSILWTMAGDKDG